MAGPGVGMKPMIASSAVLIDQLGCHDSGWWPDIDKQIFLPTSKRPFGVRTMMCGGFMGYSVGRMIRPW